MVTTLYTVDNFRLREVCLSDIYARYKEQGKRYMYLWLMLYIKSVWRGS